MKLLGAMLEGDSGDGIATAIITLHHTDAKPRIFPGAGKLSVEALRVCQQRNPLNLMRSRRTAAASVAWSNASVA